MIRILALLVILFPFQSLACDFIEIKQGPIKIIIQKDETRYITITNQNWNLPIGETYKLDVTFHDRISASSIRANVTVIDPNSIGMEYSRNQVGVISRLQGFEYKAGQENYSFDTTNSSWIETKCVPHYNPQNPFETQ